MLLLIQDWIETMSAGAPLPDITFAHNLIISCPIVLKSATEHDSAFVHRIKTIG